MDNRDISNFSGSSILTSYLFEHYNIEMTSLSLFLIFSVGILTAYLLKKGNDRLNN